MDRVSVAELAQVLFVRRRRAFFVVFAVAFAAAAVLTFALPRQYSATATLFVGENRPLSQAQNAVQLDDVLARTYAELLKSEAVQDKVAATLPFPLSSSALESKTSFDFVSGTHLIRVTASDRDPRKAHVVANTYARTFVRDRATSAAGASRERLRELDHRIAALAATIRRLRQNAGVNATGRLAEARAKLDSARSSYRTLEANATLQGSNISVASDAKRPSQPSRPVVPLYLAVGGLLALVLSTGAALLLEGLDQRVRDETVLPELLDAPLLTRVPVFRGNLPEFEETFHFLRANLRLQDAAEAPRVIGVTSAVPAEGKTTLVTELGHVLSKLNARVVLVDADLRRPRLSTRYDLQRSEGLAEVLLGHRSASEVVQRRREGFYVLGAGRRTAEASAASTGPNFSLLFEELRGEADFVIVDTAPVTAAAETSSLAAATDGVVLVLDLERSRRAEILAARGQLQAAQARLLGFVVNRVRRRDMTQYGYYHRPEPVVVSQNGPAHAGEAGPAAPHGAAR
jgi:capsular exopolysaccharide synthesis family protein